MPKNVSKSSRLISRLKFCPSPSLHRQCCAEREAVRRAVSACGYRLKGGGRLCSGTVAFLSVGGVGFKTLPPGIEAFRVTGGNTDHCTTAELPKRTGLRKMAPDFKHAIHAHMAAKHAHPAAISISKGLPAARRPSH